MIAQSFANIVKTNNGMFKSPQQANFLLSRCTNGEFVTSGVVMKHGYTLFYQCDEHGVVAVKKQTVAKGLVLQWERNVDGKLSIQNAKEIKRIQRLSAQTQRSIADRQAAYDAGDYADVPLFNGAQLRDQQSLDLLHRMLADIS